MNLAQDANFNPNQLRNKNGEWTTGGASPVQKKEDFAPDAIYPAPDLFDLLDLPIFPAGDLKLALKGLKYAYRGSKDGIKYLYGLSEAGLRALDAYLKQHPQVALANIPNEIHQAEKPFSNFFKRNKYGQHSKGANSAAQARAERESLAKIHFIPPKGTAEFFEDCEKDGHLLERHLMTPTKHNLTGMKEWVLVKRAEKGPASAFHHMKDLCDSWNAAMKDEKNIAEIKDLLNNLHKTQGEIKVKMDHSIGRYVPKGGKKSNPADEVTFVLRTRMKNGKREIYPYTVTMK